MRLNEVYNLPASFDLAVLEREDFFSTDYGNLVAFPHPTTVQTDETFISVTVLDKPIFWERNIVQVVLTVSISQVEDDQENLQKLYAVTANLITDEVSIKTLIENPNYKTLLSLLV